MMFKWLMEKIAMLNKIIDEQQDSLDDYENLVSELEINMQKCIDEKQTQWDEAQANLYSADESGNWSMM